MFLRTEGTQFKRNRSFHFPFIRKWSLSLLKSLSVMLPSSPNSLQSFDSAKVINIHELAELIGPLCIITGDWSEALRLRWTRAGEAAGPPERRIHAGRGSSATERAA